MSATLILNANDPSKFRFLTVGGAVGIERRNFSSIKEAEHWADTKVFVTSADAIEWVEIVGLDRNDIAVYSDDQNQAIERVASGYVP